MQDKTKGYTKGQKCPDCSKGIVIIRYMTDAKGNPIIEYACCSNCSWSTYRL